MNLAKIFACLLLLPVAACARSSLAARRANAASAAPFSNSEPSTGAYASSPSDEAEAPAPAPLRRARARRQRRAGGFWRAAGGCARGLGLSPPAEKKAEDRPGLGTTWGETRTSYVSNSPFERADYSQPFALVALNYNDDSGIQAMARRMGNSYASFDRSRRRCGARRAQCAPARRKRRALAQRKLRRARLCRGCRRPALRDSNRKPHRQPLRSRCHGRRPRRGRRQRRQHQPSAAT